MIYAAESRALAMAEVVVHLSLHNLPKDFVMMEILIPDSLPVDEIRPQNLPEGWNSHPPIVETQRLGDHFVNNNKSVVLRVPSAVVPGDYNYLINPHHSGFSKISIEQIEDFPWDKRLF